MVSILLRCIIFNGTSCPNLDKIDNPKVDTDMVGLEHIIEIFENEVIKPIELNNKLIPLCRGLLLYGPPGTGKTTLCRWFLINNELFILYMNKIYTYSRYLSLNR